MIGIATKDMFDIEDLKRYAWGGYDDRQKVIYFWLFVLTWVRFFCLFFWILLSGDESELSWDGEIPQSHK